MSADAAETARGLARCGAVADFSFTTVTIPNCFLERVSFPLEVNSFIEELFVGVSEGCEVGNQLGKGGAAGGCSCGHVVEVAVQCAHHFGRGGNDCGRDAIGSVSNCFDDATGWFGHVVAVAVGALFGSSGKIWTSNPSMFFGWQGAFPIPVFPRGSRSIQRAL